MAIVGVTFNDNGKVYYFNDNNLKLKKNLTVIVETEKGLQFGKIVNFFNDDNINQQNHKNVVRISTKADYLQHLNNLKDSELAVKKCKDLVKKYNLNMKIIDATWTFDRNQLVFRFIADERIDFRNLAKELGSIYKTRIELRQIGIRDKAKEIGGIGPCGRLLCCSTFLNDFDSVSINMAKNQLLSLNPTKINGSCGRLLCCLKYEDDNYTDYRKNMPNIGDNYKTEKGYGKVIAIDLFKKKIRVLLNDDEVVEEVVK